MINQVVEVLYLPFVDLAEYLLLMSFFLIICATPLILLLLPLLPLILEPLGSEALWDLFFISRVQGVLGVQMGEDI